MVYAALFASSAMYDSLELFSAFGNVVFAALVLLASGGTFALARRRTRGSLRPSLIAALCAALATAAALIATAELSWRGLGVPTVDIESADLTRVVSLCRWTVSQQRRIAWTSISPLHRSDVRAIFQRPLRLEEPFAHDDPASRERLRAWASRHGRCEIEIALLRREGDFERAASTPCARPGGARQAAEAAFAMGDVERAWTLLSPARSEVHDGFDGRLLTLLEAPPSDALAVVPAVPVRERAMWACVMERLRQHALGDRDVEVWTPLLASDSAACRILAATAPARRDTPSLRALTRLPVAALRAWRTPLTASRVILAISGRLEAPLCPARRVAAIDAAWLSRYPSLAEELLREVRDENCAYVMDRVWFPAMQSLAWNAWGDPEHPSMDAFEDLIVGWQLVDGAWERMHATLDPRFTHSRRAKLERDFHAALGPVASWAVTHLDVAYADGTPWPGGFSWPTVTTSLDSLPHREGWDFESMLRAHDIPHWAVRVAKRWDLDVVRVPAHNPTLDAWVDYWRTGTFAPAHDAPSWLRDDAMRRLVSASEDGRPADAFAAVGAPSIAHAEALSVVAYRLRGDARVFEPWLRRAWASFDPVPGSLSSWEDALQTVRACALRLRLPSLRRDVEAALTRVRHLRHARDGMLQAVLDGPRPAPEPDDDE